MKMRGEIEIDESKFGRVCKYHRGEKKGLEVWVAGLYSRTTKKCIFYPVEDRSTETMKKIIFRHVSPGSRVFTC